MGFLLLQYEYQRANRQCNLLTRTGIRLNDQIGRYTKRIEKMQSVFSKAQSRLENKYSQMSNMMGNRISGAASQIASGSTDPMVNLKNAICSCVIGGVNLGNFVNFRSIPAGATQQDILAAMTQAASEAKSVLATLIQNAQEADTEKLQAQQDAQLQPISEKEGDLQAEQNTNDALITLWEQRRDAAKEKLGPAIENSMGKYGIK